MDKNPAANGGFPNPGLQAPQMPTFEQQLQFQFQLRAMQQQQQQPVGLPPGFAQPFPPLARLPLGMPGAPQLPPQSQVQQAQAQAQAQQNVLQHIQNLQMQIFTQQNAAVAAAAAARQQQQLQATVGQGHARIIQQVQPGPGPAQPSAARPIAMAPPPPQPQTSPTITMISENPFGQFNPLGASPVTQSPQPTPISQPPLQPARGRRGASNNVTSSPAMATIGTRKQPLPSVDSPGRRLPNIRHPGGPPNIQPTPFPPPPPTASQPPAKRAKRAPVDEPITPIETLYEENLGSVKNEHPSPSIDEIYREISERFAPLSKIESSDQTDLENEREAFLLIHSLYDPEQPNAVGDLKRKISECGGESSSIHVGAPIDRRDYLATALMGIHEKGEWPTKGSEFEDDEKFQPLGPADLDSLDPITRAEILKNRPTLAYAHSKLAQRSAIEMAVHSAATATGHTGSGGRYVSRLSQSHESSTTPATQQPVDEFDDDPIMRATRLPQPFPLSSFTESSQDFLAVLDSLHRKPLYSQSFFEFNVKREKEEVQRAMATLRREREMEEERVASGVPISRAKEKGWKAVMREIPKQHRLWTTTHSTVLSNLKKTAVSCQKEMKKKATKSARLQREAPVRAKKASREMLQFWRKYEREAVEYKKKAEKEATERRKREDEMREAKRQQRKLNFLLTQTELFSHFMGGKMAEDDQESKVQKLAEKMAKDDQEMGGEDALTFEHARANAEAVIQKTLESTKRFDEETRQVRTEAAAAAAATAELMSVYGGPRGSATSPQPPSSSTSTSPAPTMEGRATSPAESGVGLETAATPAAPAAPTGGARLIPTPKMFRGDLKEYQRRGLSWLVNLYEQGINGILADEMGLGKTVQTISFLMHLVEEKDIWGPFVIIAPSSTLHNWQQEFTKFAPDLKVLPYWGNVKDRGTLRKFWSPKKLYTKDASFHVLITSYKLAVDDEKHFRRVRWQYIILDEAHQIKGSATQRWKTLLAFGCRNRLLLTGTPIQNTMQELWALLHFIMPTFFDSHDEFNEWFSKDIESHAANTSSSMLNEQQLTRLHQILKPFMLRRVKKDVELEMPPKTELQLNCELNPRQKALYKTVKETVMKTKEEGLMGLMMDLRKACNHPDLFGRAPFIPSPFNFVIPATQNPAGRNIPSSRIVLMAHNPITLTLPKLLYRSGLAGPSQLIGSVSTTADGVVPFGGSIDSIMRARLLNGSHVSVLPCDCDDDDSETMETELRDRRTVCFNIYDVAHVLSDLFYGNESRRQRTFSFSRFCNLSASEISYLLTCGPVQKMAAAAAVYKRLEATHYVATSDDFERCKMVERSKFFIRELSHPLSPSHVRCGAFSLVPPSTTTTIPMQEEGGVQMTLSKSQATSSTSAANVLRVDLMCGMRRPALRDSLAINVLDCAQRAIDCGFKKCASLARPKVLAPTITPYCSDMAFLHEQALISSNPFVKRVLAGTTMSNLTPRLPLSMIQQAPTFLRTRTPFNAPTADSDNAPLAPIYTINGASHITQPNVWRLVAGSGKLHLLDQLLAELRAEGHRVLIFSQMTKMLDILEEYMTARKYRYFRLDGTTDMSDRRDMVADFQTKTEIFAFLLSTRAGGLGINLTAADTVIFYDNDWNPTSDAQAMDRVHRIGQTRPVTVYRLVTKGTVEEKIVRRAQIKDNIQQTVYSGQFRADAAEKPSNEEIVSLLLDDDEVEAKMLQMQQNKARKGRKGAKEKAAEAAAQQQAAGVPPLAGSDANSVASTPIGTMAPGMPMPPMPLGMMQMAFPSSYMHFPPPTAPSASAAKLKPGRKKKDPATPATGATATTTPAVPPADGSTPTPATPVEEKTKKKRTKATEEPTPTTDGQPPKKKRKTKAEKEAEAAIAAGLPPPPIPPPKKRAPAKKKQAEVSQSNPLPPPPPQQASVAPRQPQMLLPHPSSGQFSPMMPMSFPPQAPSPQPMISPSAMGPNFAAAMMSGGMPNPFLNFPGGFAGMPPPPIMPNLGDVALPPSWVSDQGDDEEELIDEY